MEDRKQFTFYASFHEAAQTLDALEDRGALYEAICAYALYGTEPHLNGTAAGMFALIRPNLDASRRKASNRLGKKQSDNKTTSKQHQTEKKREDESKEEKEKESESEKENEYYILGGVGEPRADKPPRSRFIPPTVEEVKAYCQERRNNVDPQRFVGFYETKGWMVGKNKMKDWRAAVRTWEQRDGGSNQQKGEEDAGKYAGLVV